MNKPCTQHCVNGSTSSDRALSLSLRNVVNYSKINDTVIICVNTNKSDRECIHLLCRSTQYSFIHPSIVGSFGALLLSFRASRVSQKAMVKNRKNDVGFPPQLIELLRSFSLIQWFLLDQSVTSYRWWVFIAQSFHPAFRVLSSATACSSSRTNCFYCMYFATLLTDLYAKT